MEKKKSKIPVGFLIKLPLLLGIIFLIGIILLKTGCIFKEGKTKIVSEATLMKTVDESDLSTAEYIFNGIAEIPEEDDSENIECRVFYKAKVRASFDMEKIRFTVDDEKKTVKAVLPDIKLTPVLEDEYSYIPENYGGNIKDVREICEKDVIAKAEKAPEFYQSAEDNLKNIVEALTNPLLKAEGYTLIWE